MTRAEAAERHIEDPAAFEHKDTSPGGLVIFFASLFAGIALVMAITLWVWAEFTSLRQAVQPFPLIKASQIPPEPRIELKPGIQLKNVRAREDAILETYGWVDKNAGVVRIPIDRAMDLIAQRGLPYRTAPGAPVPVAPATGPESGGPQTGQAVPRFKPAQPSAAIESSVPLTGAEQTVIRRGQVLPRMATGGQGSGVEGTASAPRGVPLKNVPSAGTPHPGQKEHQ